MIPISHTNEVSIMNIQRLVLVLALLIGSSLQAAPLPGVVLHEHLEATATVATLRSIAASNGMTIPNTAFAFQDTYSYKDLEDFLNAYYGVTSVLRKAEDYYTLTKAYLEKFKSENGYYTEFIVCPFCATGTGIDWKEMIYNCQRAMQELEEPGRFYSRMLITFVRGLDTPANALEYVNWVIEQRQAGDLSIVGIHLSGDETGYPDVTPYIPAYQLARQAGLGLAAHAGETTDAQNVIDAINKLKVTRVGHGIAAINSQMALNMLIANSVTLEVCPTSNVCTHAQNITSYVTHPVDALVKAGVYVTINPDDSIFFRETTHRQEMEHVVNNFGYSIYQQNMFVATAIAASFAPVDVKFTLFAILEEAQNSQ